MHQRKSRHPVVSSSARTPQQQRINVHFKAHSCVNYKKIKVSQYVHKHNKFPIAIHGQELQLKHGWIMDMCEIKSH